MDRRKFTSDSIPSYRAYSEYPLQRTQRAIQYLQTILHTNLMCEIVCGTASWFLNIFLCSLIVPRIYCIGDSIIPAIYSVKGFDEIANISGFVAGVRGA